MKYPFYECKPGFLQSYFLSSSTPNSAHSCPVEYRTAIPQGERLRGEITIAALVAASPRSVSVVNKDPENSPRRRGGRGVKSF